MFNRSSAISVASCKMSCPTAANVESNLAFTFARFVDCTTTVTEASFTAISAEFAESEGKRTIFIARGVICVIRRILGARTRV